MIRLGAVLLTVGLIGCTNAPEKPIPTSLERIDSELIVEDSESVRLGGNDQIGLSPAVDGQDIFAASESGSVYALDLNFNQRWKTDLEANIIAGVSVSDIAVFVITAHAELVALDRNTGKIQFNVVLPSIATTRPIGSGQLVFVKTQIGRLIAINGQTGQIQWLEEAKETTMGIRGSAPMLVDRGVLYVLWETGRLVAYHADSGRVLWERQVAVSRGRSPIERILDSKGAPSIVGNMIATGTRNGQVCVVNGRNGQILWSIDSDVYPGVVVGFDAVTAVSTDSIITSYSLKTGEVIWSTAALRHRELSTPAIIGEYLAVVDLDGVLHLLNPNSGNLIGRIDAGNSKGLVAPVDLGQGALVQLQNGQLIRVDIKR